MADRGPSAPLQMVRRLACLLSARDDERRAGDSAFAWLSADPVFATAPAPMPPVTIAVAPDEPAVVPSPSSRRRAALA